MNAFRPVITAAGLAASVRASEAGIHLGIAHVGFGDMAYLPDGSEAALQNERARVPVAGGEKVAPNELRLECLLDEGDGFWVREIGFFLEDGTLFAVYSQPDSAVVYKNEGVSFAVSYHLVLEQLPPDQVELILSGPSINLTMVSVVVGQARSIVMHHIAQINTMHRQLRHRFDHFETEILKAEGQLQ